MSPTQRTLAYLRRNGWQAGVVEKWIPQTKRRQDLFGFADIVAVHVEAEYRPILVQCTSGDNVASRCTKIEGLDTAAVAARTCGIWVIGWRKLAKNGRWEPRVVAMDLLGTKWVRTELGKLP